MECIEVVDFDQTIEVNGTKVWVVGKGNGAAGRTGGGAARGKGEGVPPWGEREQGRGGVGG
jgi:hypothetical protein